MKFSEFKEMVLLETGQDRDNKNVFDSLFDGYSNDEDINLKDLKDYIEDLEDRISEIADSLVNINYSDLFNWYLVEPDIRLDYADDAIRELGADDVFHILTGGQYLYLEERGNNIYDISLRIVDILKEEEEDNQYDKRV